MSGRGLQCPIDCVKYPKKKEICNKIVFDLDMNDEDLEASWASLNQDILEVRLRLYNNNMYSGLFKLAFCMNGSLKCQTVAKQVAH